MTNPKGKERPAEQPAVRTTIVGGRPPGPGKGVGEIPRGIEVLVKKASVDPDFKALLLARRADAAREIGLALDPAEAMMLGAVPALQLEAIIARTTVSPMSRGAFLGRAAAVMLAALGADVLAAEGPPPPGGIAPDKPVKPTGIAPDRPQRFGVCAETNYKGDVALAVLDDAAYARRLAEIGRINRVIRQAFAGATNAWGADEARKGTPFPLREVQLFQLTREATFADRASADELLKKRQEELGKRVAAARKAEEDRLAALSEEERAKEKQKAELVKAAEALFEKELAKLLADPATDPPPVSRGISPTRSVFGARPGEFPTTTGVRP